jgi:beta-glucosidase
VPLTFYRSIDDLPPFDDYNMAGRTYRYFEGEVLYPFGHGLSYTTFTLANLRLDRSAITAGQTVTISFEVTNRGDQAGEEVVQLYLRHPDSGVPQPLKALKGFQGIGLQPGATQTVSFTLGTKELGYYNAAMSFGLHPGRIELLVGSSSANLPLTTILEINT